MTQLCELSTDQLIAQRKNARAVRRDLEDMISQYKSMILKHDIAIKEMTRLLGKRG